MRLSRLTKSIDKRYIFIRKEGQMKVIEKKNDLHF
jgi:hypothetical protein